MKAFSIDVLMPTASQYEVLHHFATKFYEAFLRRGIACRLLFGDDRILKTINSPPSCTIGFNGAIKMEDGSLFCDYIKVPYISCLVDPAFRFLELTQSPNLWITCDDQIGCDLLKSRGFNRTSFLPHAVECDLEIDLKQARIYDITFLGTCIDGESRKKNWKKIFPKQTFQIMEEASEIALANKDTSFITPLLKHIDPKEYHFIYEEVEFYVKAIDRLRLITAFPENEVHVFGGGLGVSRWESLLKNHPHIFVHPPVDYNQALQIMKQSKIVLNSSIKNKYGAHERIFTALACGAVSVTTDNPYIQETFDSGKNLLLYPPDNFDELKQHVKDLLANEKKRQQIAEAGKKIVMQHHTWDHRVSKLLFDSRDFINPL